jgi:chitin-binding protein
VYRSDAASFVASVTSTTYADTGLTAATEYNYTVRAVDAAGNESAASNTATTSTFPAAAAADVNQTRQMGFNRARERMLREY